MERYRFLALLGGSAAICAVLTMAPRSAVCQDARKTAKPNGEAQHCQTIKKDSKQMPCHKEENVVGPVRLSQQQPIEPATWQLARTANPAGGPDTISITKIAEGTRSDQDVTGLMLRCAEGATTEVLVIVIKPLPLRTHPKVTVVAGATTTEFTASVVTPGVLVLLPEKASALVEHAWQSIPELTVAIAGDHRLLHGVIPLADISTAMQTLQSNCPKALHSR
ncbi:MAG: hypothetical protein WB689_12845 [Xanthobacteraceae bacterium]|jgi:hypothetical protein